MLFAELPLREPPAYCASSTGDETVDSALDSAADASQANSPQEQKVSETTTKRARMDGSMADLRQDKKKRKAINADALILNCFYRSASAERKE
jgi:hypothetical protein